MKICRKKWFCLFILLPGILLCGFIFTSPETVLDAEKRIVYQNYSIDEVLSAFAAEGDAAKAEYDRARILLLGRVEETAEKNKTVTLVSVSGKQEGKVKCSFSDEESIALIKTLSKGEFVKVYGKFSVSFMGSQLHMDGSRIEKTAENTVSHTVYSSLEGKTVDVERMYARTLAGDKITYYIPAEWEAVEYNIAENDLGSIEGFQYRLNELPGSAAVLPESLFVCYFDYKHLKNSSDKGKTDLIERAIIANILKKNPDALDKFPVKKTDTYYGAKYQYYQDAYKNPLGQGHHVEFVFQQAGAEGIIVYLYVYSDANHVEDIMFLMRLLEVH